MSRRLLGIVAAVLLAGAGTFGLVLYVRGAEDRALAGEELTNVYVVHAAVPAGTPATELGSALAVEQVPVKVRADDAVTDLAAVADKVTGVALVPGEQLLLSRLVNPEDQSVSGQADVPPGLVEVTISLSPTRAAGARLKPGQTVSVLSSFAPFDLSGALVETEEGDVAPASGSTPNTTHVLVQNVLVTAVQSTEATAKAEDATDAPAPQGDLLVTLAVTPADAERVVFTAEFGTLWLAGEGTDVIPGGTQVQSRGSIYQQTGPVAQ
jgi:pilus assembly protein CpaB